MLKKVYRSQLEMLLQQVGNEYHLKDDREEGIKVAFDVAVLSGREWILPEG